MQNKGSHPRTLLKTVQRNLDSLQLYGSKIVVAVSGGPDSMATLHVLSLLRKEFNLALVAHGVNHGLRPEAASELDLVENFCEQIQVPFTRSSVKIEGDHGIQDKARKLRYAELKKTRSNLNFDLIATGHNYDDRAETVLFRLLRGNPIASFDVLRPLDVGQMLLRPIVNASRRDVMLHIERWDIPYATDPSNATTKYARNRLRNEVIPYLTQISPNLIDHLNNLANESRDLSKESV